ncbi:MAG: heavy-metal-associated domain-containing protein [Pirellulales bacterium]
MKYFALLMIVAAVGCGQQSTEAVVVGAPTSAVAFNVAGAPTVEFNVPDMMCPEGCGAKTKEILSKLPGAKEVVINFDAKTATVAIEAGKFDADGAVAALKDYGFENSSLKADAGTPPQTDQSLPSS